jgi:uncharacterized protein
MKSLAGNLRACILAAGVAACLIAPHAHAIETIPSLVRAARDNDMETAIRLLKAARKGELPAATDGTTALHWAVHNDNLPLVERLLAMRAPVNARSDYGATPMSEAAILGNVAMIRRLLDAGADPESPNADGQTALMVLARGGHVEAARLLLDAGVKVDAREGWRQQTALMWAAAQAQPAVTRLLVSHGADVNARSLVNDWERQITSEPRMQSRPSGGYTPLLYAARRGCRECAEVLVEGGADPDLTDPDGVTPMLLATINFNFDTASWLLAKGANPNLWDRSGRAPLYAAVDLATIPAGGRSDRPSLDRTTSLQLIEQLLVAGANPDMQLKRMPPYRSLRDDRGADGMQTTGATPLLRAARAADIPAMKLLLDHGAKVDLPNVNGVTPLMAAAGIASSKIDTRGRYKTSAQAVEAINLLVAHGADVNRTDSSGQTAAFGAAVWGWNDVLQCLVGHGARLDLKDARGRNLVDVAMGTGGGGRAGSDPQPQTAAFLRELMAKK